jgi:plastocyanin
MDGSLFFWLGAALVLAALGIAAIGIRGRASFPPNRAALVLGTAVFAAIVIGTTAFAVVNAQEEQEDRNKELAEEEAAAEEETTATEAPQPSPGGQPQAAGGGKQPPPQQPPAAATTLDVTSPSDGSLVFDPNGLETKAGSLTITYSNPSPVPHSLAVENADGDVLGETQIFTGGEQEVTLNDLTAGEYVFFCTVPGHREAGMEGDLTVD